MHGGTTRYDIIRSVKKAQQLIKDNIKSGEERAKQIEKGDGGSSGQKKPFNPDNHHVVLFFDEANTTNSLEVIKEVMCDRRLDGCKITENIKFVAACNPYRK